MKCDCYLWVNPEQRGKRLNNITLNVTSTLEQSFSSTTTNWSWIFHWNQRDNPFEVKVSDGIARLCLLCPHLRKTLWTYSPSQLKRLGPGTWQFLNVSLYRPWPWPFQWQERNLKMSCSICRFSVSRRIAGSDHLCFTLGSRYGRLHFISDSVCF